jgi:hypothetical protein
MTSIARRLINAAAVLVVTLMVVGCSSSNPYDYKIEPPLDVLEVLSAQAHRSAPAAVVVMLPPQNLAGTTFDSMAATLNGSVRSRASAAANIDIRTDDQSLRQLMGELAQRGNPLYSTEGAAEIGRIRQAGYVAYLSLNGVSITTEPYRTWRYVEGQRVEVTNWEVRVNASASLSVVSVETAVVVYEVSQSSRAGASGYESPPDTRVELEHARQAVEALGPMLTGGLGGVFPVTGYISEMRGSQRFVLIETGGRSVGRGVLFTIVEERIHNDPVRGLVTVEDPVGEAVAQVSDGRGVWARVLNGKPNLRKGQKAVTKGAFRQPSFFEHLFGDG